MSRVLVAGANGKTGRLLVASLASDGHEPVAMVRDPEQAADLRELGAAEVLVQDLEDRFSGAVEGA